MVTIYRRETVISKAEVDAQTPEQALKFVRASVGMSHFPKFTETERRDGGYSLSPDIGKRKGTAEEVPVRPDQTKAL